MDMMDLLLACEDLVPQVDGLDTSVEDITRADSDRWQRLFAFSPSQAVYEIQKWRGTFGRYTVTADTWSMIKADLNFPDYDKEAYEYAVAKQRFHGSTASQPEFHHRQDNSAALSSSYLFRLDGPIPDAETLKEFADLQSLPETLQGSRDPNGYENNDDDEEGHTMLQQADTKAKFCLVDGCTRMRVLQKIAQVYPTFRPTFIRDTKARKDLSRHSLYPTLGIDAILPHHRADSADDTVRPAQDEYPVCYFFYGTLADPAVLSQVIGLPSDRPPQYHFASVRGGRLTTWAGKYKGLVCGDVEDVVHGSAFLVRNAEEEDALRYYETDKYEVVRCGIQYEDSEVTVAGLTFRLLVG
jgi:hypothetical protein